MEFLESIKNWIVEAHSQWDWMLEIFLVVLAVVTINLALKYFLVFLHKRVESTRNVWDDAIFAAISLPLRGLIWVLGLSIAAEVTTAGEESTFAELIDPARRVGVIVMMVWFLLRLVNEVSNNILEANASSGKTVDHTTVDAIAKLLRASIFITGALVILQSLGFSISGVLAFGGVGGLAIGLAAKDLLANVFGGLTVYLDRPFSKGDWIRSPEKDIEGTVEHIGWRRTVIRRFDKRPMYVPNAIFTNIVVENPSRMTHRRINETMGVRYDDISKVAPILADVKQMIMDHAEIDHKQIVLVYFNEFGAHSLDFFVYCMTVTCDWAKYHEVKQDVLLKIHDIVDKHGAEMAFPTTTLHVPEPVSVQQA